MMLMGAFSTLVMLLTRQPYDSTAVQAMLPAPITCEAPCWVGIQPGVTSLSGAMAVLQQHDWVTFVEYQPTTPPSGGRLVWQWTASASSVIDPTRPGVAGIHRELVSWIQIPTTLALGDVWLAKGDPVKAVTRAALPAHNRVRHYVMYDEQAVQWRSMIDCPWQLQRFWHASVDLWVGVSSIIEMPTYQRPARTACYHE